MPAFAAGQTHVTSVPWVEVEGLPAGTYRFRLVAVDDGGSASLPAEAVVEVQAPAPTVGTSFLRSVVEPVIRSPLVNPRLPLR